MNIKNIETLQRKKIHMANKNISSDQENAKRDQSEIPFYTHLMTKIKMKDHSERKR